MTNLAEGSIAAQLYQLVRQKSAGKNVVSLSSSDLSKELFGTPNRAEDISALLRKLEGMGLLGLQANGKGLEATAVREVPPSAAPATMVKTAPRPRKEPAKTKASKTKIANKLHNIHTFRTLFNEEQTEHPERPYSQNFRAASKEFHRRYPNGSWVHIQGRSPDRPPYTTTYLRHWLEGREHRGGEQVFGPSLIKEHGFENKIANIRGRLEHSTPSAVGKVPVRPSVTGEVTKRVTEEFRSIIKDELKQAQRDGTLSSYEDVVRLLSPLNRKLDDIKKLMENSSSTKMDELRDAFYDVILALHNAGNGPTKSALGSLFGSQIRVRSQVRREQERRNG